MEIPDRERIEVLYKLFDVGVVDDQRNYYRSTVKKHRKSATEVNVLRAVFALLTGLSAALAGLLVQSTCGGGVCKAVADTTDKLGPLKPVVDALLLLAIIAPALGAAFGTLADLYQWDRLTAIYDAGLENLEVAKSRHPDPAMDDQTYWFSVAALTEGTLNVMRDETAQWGQLIRTPEQLDQFIENAKQRAALASADNVLKAAGGSNPDATPNGGTRELPK